MANAQFIKRRIKSAKNIAQITRAMQMVAASKMKKANKKALSGKPYADKIYEMTVSFAKRVDAKNHPLLQKKQQGKKLAILISTNKGLCGGLNNTLFRSVKRWFPQDDAVQFVTVGRKGREYVVRAQGELGADFSESNSFTQSIPALTKLAVDGFLDGTFSSVTLIYNDFVSALKQVPAQRTILPITSLPSAAQEEDKVEEKNLNMTIEPSIKDLLDTLLIHYLENQIRTSVLQAEASEHSARMIAMKNATENADEVTGALTLEYNKIRQQKITSEILDMVTARSAVDS